MTITESSIRMIADALQKISEQGISVNVHLYDGCGDMRMDLNAVKLTEGLDHIAEAIISAECDE